MISISIASSFFLHCSILTSDYRFAAWKELDTLLFLDRNLLCASLCEAKHISLPTFYLLNKKCACTFEIYFFWYKCPGCFRKQWATFQITHWAWSDKTSCALERACNRLQ